MKKIVLILAGLVVGAAFAVVQPDVQVISFCSQGGDTYADGTPVNDGECYAPVWSEDGVFEGIAGDGSAKDPNDKVVYIGAFAKDGKCKYVEFHIANGFKPNGKFDIWVLDTRVFKDGKVDIWGKKNGKVIVAAAAKANGGSVEVKSGAGVPSSEMAGITGGASTTESSVDSDVEAPVISRLSFDRDGEGNRVTVISFDKTVLGARYSIRGATSPTMKGAQEGAVTTGTGEPMSIVAPKFGNFYQAILK